MTGARRRQTPAVKAAQRELANAVLAARADQPGGDRRLARAHRELTRAERDALRGRR